YFPVAFLIKTQLPLILLLLLTAFMVLGRRSFEGKMLILAVAVYACAALKSNINIGVRHLLPIYPLLIVWVSQAVRWPIEPLGTNLAKGVAIAGLAFWYLFSTLSIHPYYLAYFNELVGGPQNGYMYLLDSNVDHSQDLKRLSLYLHEAGIEDAKVLCWDHNNVWSCNGIRYYLPQASFWNPNIPSSFPNLTSASFVVEGKTPAWLSEYWPIHNNTFALQQWKETKDQLESLKPIHTIGYSIDIYYLNPPSQGFPYED